MKVTNIVHYRYMIYTVVITEYCKCLYSSFAVHNSTVYSDEHLRANHVDAIKAIINCLPIKRKPVYESS
uniref:Uncharacterized protein n=1 Tax=viral metagenome TaxID=1070528 RepID=A0A6H1ZG95_9ZZZZ